MALPGVAEGWQARLVLDRGDVGIWRVAAAPVFPQYPRPEIVGLDDEGSCWVMVSYSGKWTPFRLLQDGKWLGAIAWGELEAAAPGTETYVGGAGGRLFQLRSYHDGALDARRIADFPGLEIHTLVAGDFLPRHPGQELLVLTSPGAMFLVSSRERGGVGGDFEITPLGELPSRIRDAVVLPDGHTVATAARDGAVSLLTFVDGKPQWQLIHRLQEGRGRIALGNQVSGGLPLLYSSADDGRIYRHAHQTDGSWRTTLLYRGPLGPRGLAAGRLAEDPEQEAVAIFGYSGKVELLTPVPGAAEKPWQSRTIFHDRARGHWLITAELHGGNQQDELFLSGYGGRIIMLRHEDRSSS